VSSCRRRRGRTVREESTRASRRGKKTHLEEKGGQSGRRHCRAKKEQSLRRATGQRTAAKKHVYGHSPQKKKTEEENRRRGKGSRRSLGESCPVGKKEPRQKDVARGREIPRTDRNDYQRFQHRRKGKKNTSMTQKVLPSKKGNGRIKTTIRARERSFVTREKINAAVTSETSGGGNNGDTHTASARGEGGERSKAGRLISGTGRSKRGNSVWDLTYLKRSMLKRGEVGYLNFWWVL